MDRLQIRRLDAAQLRDADARRGASGSLFKQDRTCTAGGKRALIEALRAPFRSLEPIERRLDRTEAMLDGACASRRRARRRRH